MKEYPILMSAPMVRAILEGRKTMTRRTDHKWLKVKKGDRLWAKETFRIKDFWPGEESNTESGYECISEAMATVVYEDGQEKRIEGLVENEGEHGEIDEITQAEYFSTKKGNCQAIHMPKWASRILLEATKDAYLERLQEISEEDAMSEGITREIICNYDIYTTADFPRIRVNRFKDIWDTLHKPNSPKGWNANPEIVVIPFKVVKGV